LQAAIRAVNKNFADVERFLRCPGYSAGRKSVHVIDPAAGLMGKPVCWFSRMGVRENVSSPFVSAEADPVAVMATVCTHFLAWNVLAFFNKITKGFAMQEKEIDVGRCFIGNFGDARLKKLECCYTNKW
jgi:hypothetical protein